jgi:hypothetical protein
MPLTMLSIQEVVQEVMYDTTAIPGQVICKPEAIAFLAPDELKWCYGMSMN